MATLDQKKKLLKAKIAVALHDELLKVYRLIAFEKQFFWVFLKPCSFCQFFQRLAGWPAWE
jgi:hypothetical protein